MMASRFAKKKKPSTQEAFQYVKELTVQQFSERPRKKRKPVRFEINTDPKTGVWDINGTYCPSTSSRTKSQEGLTRALGLTG